MIGVREKVEKSKAAQQAEQQARADAMNQKYRDLFASELGREVLADLDHKFQPTTRAFRSEGGRAVDPWKAASRDGEKAVVNYILRRIRRANESKTKNT